MKAENEKSSNAKTTDDLRDEMLSKAVNESFNEDGLSSNFTHQVMGKIDQLEKSPKRKPLVAWWAWIIIGGSFATALILAILNAPMPEERTIVIEDNVYDTYSEISTYLPYVLVGMAIILFERIINFRKKFSV